MKHTEKYWDQETECMPKEKLMRLQLERLKKTVAYVYGNVPYYKSKMVHIGIEPGDIRSLDDLQKLPITTKQDMRDSYPFGMFAAPLSNIVRIHASSGTTGKQTVVGYTEKDIGVWSDCMARCLVMANADKNSLIQVSYGYGLFTGGLGTHYGAERLGASVIPSSSGNTMRQITMLVDFGVTHLCCTPSYALYIAEMLGEAGYSKKDLKLISGCFGAEPWTGGMRNEIENGLGLRAHDIYGLSEIMGPSVSQDCRFQNGLHIWEDCFIPEITDPITGSVLDCGCYGDLVITTINKEGIPLIRYKTKDICSLIADKCECGRTHIRMTKPAGRTDDMLIIRGVNVFPSQIEGVLLESGETAPHYQIIVDRIGNLDHMVVELEVSEKMFSDDIEGMEILEKKLLSKMESILGISCKIKLVEPKSLSRNDGTAKINRVIDKRKYE